MAVAFPQPKTWLTLALAAGLGACVDAPTATVQAPLTASHSLSVPTPADAQSIAQGLALAMRDPSIRRQVHSAMRESRFNEHKLVLQDVANTAAGDRILGAASAALGQNLGSIKNTIANLPALDFYLPFRSHRQTWKPTADVYVAVTFDPDAPTITAYGTNGKTLSLRLADGTPAVPLIILHPAEPKVIRGAPLAQSDPDLIESPSASPSANKSIGSAPTAVAFTVVPPDGGGGGGGGTPAGTYINYFNIQVGDGWFGDSEMQFSSSAVVGYQGFVTGNNGTSHYMVSTASCPMGTYGQNGVAEDQGYSGLFMLSPSLHLGTPVTCNGQSAMYAIHIEEIDGGANGANDDYGWRLYSSSAGGYPLGAAHDVIYSFYGETYPYDPADPGYNRTAYLRTTQY
jgi:hypothetical protein